MAAETMIMETINQNQFDRQLFPTNDIGLFFVIMPFCGMMVIVVVMLNIHRHIEDQHGNEIQ